MHGESKPLNIREIVISNVVIGLVPAVVISRVQSGAPLVTNLIAGQIYSHCIGTLVHLSLHWASPRLARLRSWRRWLAVILILALDATIGCAIGGVLMMVLGYYDIGSYWRQFQFAYRISLTVTLIFGVVGAITESFTKKLEWASRQRERAVQLATEARLSSLESRIHPHFLFNALNSISSLVREDPDRAERLIERMASLLRFSLDAGKSGLVTLAEELEIVRGYLEIEKTRFGSRLQFTIDVPEEALSTRIPPLSIQTLVENSVKHTIGPSRGGGAVEVRGRLEGATVEIEIRDEGTGVDLRAAPSGHGLDLLQSRLEVLYGGAASLRSEGCSLILRIPCSAPTLSMTKS